MTKIIAVASGKGGVGKTTTTINLGCALTGFGKDTVIIDGNLTTPHIALHLGSVRLDSTLNDALLGRKSITDTAYLHPSGLRVIPASIALPDSQACSTERMHHVLLDLIGTTEVVLLDIGAGAGRETMDALRATDEVLLVVTPDMLSVGDAIRTAALAKEANIPIMGAVLNRVTGDKSELSVKNVEALLDVPVLGVVPEDQAVKRALAMRMPVVHSHPNAPAAIGYKRLAASLLGQVYEPYAPRKEEEKGEQKEKNPFMDILQKLGW